MQPVISNDFPTHAKILGSFIALMWAVEIVDRVLLRDRLTLLGIRPRTQVGLRGIVFAPLLHGTWSHLTANTLPFVVLGWFVLLGGVEEFAIVTAVVWLVSGCGVWLLGRPNTLHIGASSLIFGYFGFLLLRSYFEQDVLSAGFSVVVALLYGPLIWGVLPLRRGVSWLGHLFGFVGGVLAARYLPELSQWLTRLG
ncbi:rhomboid family intramembrane serine protease [Leptolyngbya sp. FACHB-36]|uniref:rhomboid family intramembrane serine protease n=1 Tax=Leptolyngbya sp. FACHB-36 TaxID=2692808 RepID=UPI0016810510|nr:rhomboid family intramembrane serine protease [Leptolyngbya sp. FACHB-36]MBD2019106.1 rhomboid family intramembrane serine protease [Leptolyngbya sp. FACHB-36]